MEVITKFYQPWLEKWGNHRFQAILLICFFLWTPLLLAETLQVQNSCYPMIKWSKDLRPECLDDKSGDDKSSGNKSGGDKSSGNKSGGDKSGGDKSIGDNLQESLGQLIDSAKQHPDLSGATIGIAFGTGAAIANAPLVVTVGIGIALWLAIRTALSS
ncbi:hypothetical protein [Microcoleus sp. B9-D4]|uniref:hypothetical protein n=1 Tax=Microcoleus sp. B9-D4 TaxID=2818711 RepID=UPI002FD76AB6